MRALIDGDIIVYRVGYTTMELSLNIALARAREMIQGILRDSDAIDYRMWLSDSAKNNYRYQIYPQYKANRLAMTKPTHYEEIKQYLMEEWGAKIAYGMEADDAMGIHQDKETCSTCICSIDKDLLQIPGLHYNFVNKEWTAMHQWDGLKWFYKQLLIGDKVDNITGCTGIGSKKSSLAIDPIEVSQGEESLFQKVYETYLKQEVQKGGKSEAEVLSHILTTGQLLRILQTENEPLWHFPSLIQMEASPVSFTPVRQEEPILSTEPIIQEMMSGFVPHGTVTDSTSLAVLQD